MKIGINEKPKLSKWIILSLQHVFAMFGATILVPILVNGACDETVLTIPVALFTSGIGTLIYTICTKGKSPVYLGSSFAFITPMITGFAIAGTGGVYTGIMAVGLIYAIVALIIKLTNKNIIEKILPKVVIGPMIMIIGLSLASSAVSNIGIDGKNFDIRNLLVALFTFIVTIITMTKAKGFLKIIPFLIGIVSGYVLSMILGIVDYTPIAAAKFFEIPKFEFPFLTYKPNFLALITIAPIALVTIAEHVGDHLALSTIIKKDLIKDPGLDRTLLGDGLATFVAGLLGGPANTTYGENTSVVGLTKVASVHVIRLAALFAILFAFLGKLTAIFSTIPNSVLGGISLLLYGFIAVNGLKILIENQIDFDKPKNIIIASTMLILGLGGAVITISSGNLNLSISGMALAALAGILLNIFIKDEDKKKSYKK